MAKKCLGACSTKNARQCTDMFFRHYKYLCAPSNRLTLTVCTHREKGCPSFDTFFSTLHCTALCLLNGNVFAGNGNNRIRNGNERFRIYSEIIELFVDFYLCGSCGGGVCAHVTRVRLCGRPSESDRRMEQVKLISMPIIIHNMDIYIAIKKRKKSKIRVERKLVGPPSNQCKSSAVE